MLTRSPSQIIAARIRYLRQELSGPCYVGNHAHTYRAQLKCPTCAQTLLTLNNLYAEQTKEGKPNAFVT